MSERNIMEEYLRTIVKDEIQKEFDLSEIALKEEEANQIVIAILPYLDKLVSKRIKEHLNEIANFIKTI